ncbi:MAG: helix-turn-helix transcriptional regulator [Clostridia bacterium]|nr:helix-turn-helix transcriptional regulator [Clostridia bacterium]
MHSDIGEKIRKLRIDRNMTQAELAGDQITRNMLSRVENGAALPSLPTVWYLAERLDVPAGFLLAEGDDDRVWRKMNRIDSIRRMLRSGEARICLELCRSEGDADDEIYLIMAQTSLALGTEAFESGRLHHACKALDEALEYAEKTIYNTSAIRMSAALYFRFMHGLSPTLYSEVMADVDDPMLGATDPLGRYVLAREALKAGEARRVESYLSKENGQDSWQAHFRAHLAMKKGDYVTAEHALSRLLHAQTGGEVLLYCVFCDLEICCRELDDFKGAYEYSQSKMALLEKMLRKE